jgi:bacteriorhodopsin
VQQDPGKKDLVTLLWVEYGVNIVEGCFYIWMLSRFSSIKNITRYRYYDWMITTPVMLFTYSMYLLILKKEEHNEPHNLKNLVFDEKYTLLTVTILNGLMLWFGYLGESKLMPVVTSTVAGFVPFCAMFYIIYDNYARHTSVGSKTFVYFIIVWAMYGVAALTNYTVKNVLFNILDLFAKNFFALFLAYIIYFR